MLTMESDQMGQRSGQIYSHSRVLPPHAQSFDLQQKQLQQATIAGPFA
jgi:hypothetical protein